MWGCDHSKCPVLQVEKNERPEAALVRELQEELGITVSFLYRHVVAENTLDMQTGHDLRVNWKCRWMRQI